MTICRPNSNVNSSSEWAAKQKDIYISFYIYKKLKYIQQYHTRFDQRFALKGWNSERGNVITWGTFLNFQADALPVLACKRAIVCMYLVSTHRMHCIHIYYYTYDWRNQKNSKRIWNYNSIFFSHSSKQSNHNEFTVPNLRLLYSIELNSCLNCPWQVDRSIFGSWYFIAIDINWCMGMGRRRFKRPHHKEMAFIQQTI